MKTDKELPLYLLIPPMVSTVSITIINGLSGIDAYTQQKTCKGLSKKYVDIRPKKSENNILGQDVANTSGSDFAVNPEARSYESLDKQTQTEIQTGPVKKRRYTQKDRYRKAKCCKKKNKKILVSDVIALYRKNAGELPLSQGLGCPQQEICKKIPVINLEDNPTYTNATEDLSSSLCYNTLSASDLNWNPNITDLDKALDLSEYLNRISQLSDRPLQNNGQVAWRDCYHKKKRSIGVARAERQQKNIKEIHANEAIYRQKDRERIIELRNKKKEKLVLEIEEYYKRTKGAVPFDRELESSQKEVYKETAVTSLEKDLTASNTKEDVNYQLYQSVFGDLGTGVVHETSVVDLNQMFELSDKQPQDKKKEQRLLVKKILWSSKGGCKVVKMNSCNEKQQSDLVKVSSMVSAADSNVTNEELKLSAGPNTHPAQEVCNEISVVGMEKGLNKSNPKEYLSSKLHQVIGNNLGPDFILSPDIDLNQMFELLDDKQCKEVNTKLSEVILHEGVPKYSMNC